MPIDFALTDDQVRLRTEARTFAHDVLTHVHVETALLPTAMERFSATKPFYEQAVAAGFLRRLIPLPVGGQGTGVVDMAVLAEEFYALDANVSLTLLGTMLGLFPLILAGRPDQASWFTPFLSGRGAPLAAFASSEPGGSANFAAPAPAEGVRTMARLDDSGWVIDGAKRWVSSGTGWAGTGADVSAVVCRTDPDAAPDEGITVLAVAGTVARLGVRRPVGYLRVCSLTEGGCVAWMLRLVRIGVEGEGPCTDIMEIRRPDDLVDIANLGLTLSEAKRLLASVQREMGAAQASEHADRRPSCARCGGACRMKDYRDHAVSTLFGQVTVRLPRFRCAPCGGIEAGLDWPSHCRSTPELDRL